MGVMIIGCSKDVGDDDTGDEFGGDHGTVASSESTGSETGGVTSAADETSASTTDPSTTEATGTDTDSGAHCAELDEAACEADAECLAVLGHPYVKACVQPETEFLGCIPAQDCPAGEINVCLLGVPYAIPDGCFPMDVYVECMGPGEPGEECP